MKKYEIYIIIVILFIISIVLAHFLGNNEDYIKAGKLYISEIVASNSYTHKNEDEEYFDYIELYNGNNYDINLEGYYLSDSLVDIKKWRFPSVTIKEHEYMIIYASGLDKCDRNCHTNFKMNAEGETITLTEPKGNIISRVTYPKLNADTSYSYVDRKYRVTIPSPGYLNNHDIIDKKDFNKYQIVINEYMSHNKGISYASNGSYYDFIELYNKSSNDLNLKGLCLTDDDNLNKFTFPDVTIKANDYLVVYLTGGEEVEDSVYANFKLSDTDKKITLSMDGKVIDEVEVYQLPTNVSYGRKDDKWLYFMTPTPGRINDTYGIEKWGE